MANNEDSHVPSNYEQCMEMEYFNFKYHDAYIAAYKYGRAWEKNNYESYRKIKYIKAACYFNLAITKAKEDGIQGCEKNDIMTKALIRLWQLHLTIYHNESKAKEYFTEAMKIDEKYSIAYCRGGIFKKEGNYEKAEEYYNLAIAEAEKGNIKNHVRTNTIVKAKIHLGNIYMRTHRDTIKAEKFFTESIALNDKYPKAYRGMSSVFFERRDSLNSIKYREIALKIRSNSYKDWTLLGWDYLLIDENDKARSCFEKALKISPGHNHALNGMKAITQGWI